MVGYSKSITFTEYGYPTCDKSTNQPNVFFDAQSSESATAYWSIWNAADGGGFLPAVDQTLSLSGAPIRLRNIGSSTGIMRRSTEST